MTYIYGRRSLEVQGTIHPHLIQIFDLVLEHMDHSLLWGFRGEEDQNRMVKEHKSYLSWPNSKHNTLPSLAVDAAPGKMVRTHSDISPTWTINWQDHETFNQFGFFVLGVAAGLAIPIRWLGDGDQDYIPNNRDGKKNFYDAAHFELIL